MFRAPGALYSDSSESHDGDFDGASHIPGNSPGDSDAECDIESDTADVDDHQDPSENNDDDEPSDSAERDDDGANTHMSIDGAGNDDDDQLYEATTGPIIEPILDHGPIIERLFAADEPDPERDADTDKWLRSPMNR